MSPVPFALSPFPGLPAPAGVRVGGEAARAGAALHLRWRLDAPPGAIAVPEATAPARRFGLWDATCCEAFLRRPGGPGYWELNFSPGGAWNAFRLAGYRAGMVEEPAIGALSFAVERRPDGLDVDLRLDLAPLGLADDPWELAIAAVIAEPTGRLTYWALAHPAAEPDFHDAGAFRLRLAAPGAGM